MRPHSMVVPRYIRTSRCFLNTVLVVVGVLCPTSSTVHAQVSMTAAPFGNLDHVIAARKTTSGWTLERWDPVARRQIATVSVREPVDHLITVNRSVVLASRHEVSIVPVNLGVSPHPIWRTS